MWLEFFKFELRYRMKRPETYAFFGLLLLFSIVGVDFIFQGIELGPMKKNAPLVIAKTMGAITGIFMVIASMIMGVPVLRDYQYDTTSLLFVNPITKRAYLSGRFLGSFVTLIFIFSGLLLGMLLGAKMPWHKAGELLPFDTWPYVQAFVVVVLPSLFFGACVFFVTGMLSKKLLVVYTQGMVIFVLFLLTKAVTNEYLQGLLDPFSLTTLTQFAKDWTISERNTGEIVFSGILSHNKLLWMTLGAITLLLGYRRFSFSIRNVTSKRLPKMSVKSIIERTNYDSLIPKIRQQHDFWTKCIQLLEVSKFHLRLLLKEAAFWGIVICGMVVIAINSVNLGTVYGVNSYPTTYFIIAELQEMSMYFFVVILLFYSGELIWKERAIGQDVLQDATSISSLVTMMGKFFALVGAYVILMLGLMVAGMLIQMSHGYYQFDLKVYFTGFFIEILPFLILYTCMAFFLQAISKNKFIGIALTLVFVLVNIGTEYFGFNHSLYKFGGKPLGIYSEMNGYGHLLEPYLWIKAYWGIFGLLLLLGAAVLVVRGQATHLGHRLRSAKYRLTRTGFALGGALLVLFMLLGSYIFYNTNILNTYWSDAQERNFRAAYERTLKPLEYVPQPKITEVDLQLELYPETRSYEVRGTYYLKNTTDAPIAEVHLQKRIASHLALEDVVFEGGAQADQSYQQFDYTIYTLASPLAPQDSLRLEFTQSFLPKGFEEGKTNTEVVANGTFFNSTEFPTLGYNNKYELQDEDERMAMGLPSRHTKARIDDPRELVNARSGGDSDGIRLTATIGTSAAQTALTAGQLVDTWTKEGRNYFQYRTDQPVINLYPIVSAAYKMKKERWVSQVKPEKVVDLEIYYHPGHTYTLDRMMTGMKASLDYYSRHFSAYPYRQLRIMEFPRYAEFAQSLPSTIPFSEALGFMLDIDDTTDVDMALYITAHEVAHQWFGMQVEAANVQGRNFILETLAQYGALMVLQRQYGPEKVRQFLEGQQETYDRERKKVVAEASLALVENQDFVYYNKGALAMYQLQQLLGEDQVNLALRRFIRDWRSDIGLLKTKTKHYPTSRDLLDYFKAVCPKEMQSTLYEMFETTQVTDWVY